MLVVGYLVGLHVGAGGAGTDLGGIGDGTDDDERVTSSCCVLNIVQFASRCSSVALQYTTQTTLSSGF